MELINFRLSGRFAHFLRADASASALSYPIPPRTVILGIMGAVLGLPKDMPQVVLEPANIAISGKLPKTHWHRAKLRKNPPALLPRVIKKTQKSDKRTKPEKATLIRQEWLIDPDYSLLVSIPEPYHSELKNRLNNRQWYFCPSLGISEMIADIEYLGANECYPLPNGIHDIQSVFSQESGTVDIEKVIERRLSIHLLQMPRTVTPDRVFSHCSYITERNAKPIPVETKNAFQIENKMLMFL